MMPPTRPTTALPEGYALKASLDLSKSIPALVAVNVFGVAVLLAGGWALLYAMDALRPGSVLSRVMSIGVSSISSAVGLIAAVLVISALVIVLHEAVHGIFFWAFTRERPLFGFKGIYAYAAAPRWYIPRGQYLLIGLAPLVCLTLLGLALTPVLPESLLLPVYAFMLMNASGAAGDILVVAWLLTRRRGVLARDSGDAISLYEPA